MNIVHLATKEPDIPLGSCGDENRGKKERDLLYVGLVRWSETQLQINALRVNVQIGNSLLANMLAATSLYSQNVVFSACFVVMLHTM